MCRFIPLPLLLILSACGSASTPNATATSSLKAEDTVFGDQVKALEKARAVEGTLQQEKESTDAAIDAATAPKAE